MKVSCQSCGAQYNLPDDKVRGRKAKVRCKKCSAQIIVDGTALAFEDDDEATRVMMSPALSADGEPVWTVNLSDEEQLDMTDAEVIAGWRDGRVTDDAYVWREGMEEWLPILESTLAPALKALAPKSAPVNPEPAPMPAPVAAPAPSLGSAPKASVFGSSPKTSAFGSSPKASSFGSSPKASSGLGSSPQAAPAPSAAPVVSPTPPPAAAHEPEVAPKPKAQRSDDTSKAFSFALSGSSAASSAKKASRPPAAAAGGLFGGVSASNPAASVPNSPAASSAASSENSVMFSLDALKAAAAVEPKRSSVRVAAAGDARVNEDILTLGGPSRFDDQAMPLIDIEVPPPAPKAYAPVAAAPLAAPSKKKSPWGMVILGVVAVAGMAGAYLIGQQGKEEAPVVVQNDPDEATRGTRTGADAPEADPANATGEQAAATAAGATAAPTVTAAPVAAPSPNVGGGRVSGGGEAKPPTSDKPAETPKTDKPSPSPAPAPAPKAAGPAFNVGAAKAALGSAAGNAAGCRAPAGPSGTGKVQVTFAPSGNVTSALIVSGPFGGTPVGSCVARTFRAAKVPAFDGSPMTVSKSFTIK